MQFHKQYTEPRTAVLINTKHTSVFPTELVERRATRRAGAEMKVMARTRGRLIVTVP